MDTVHSNFIRDDRIEDVIDVEIHPVRMTIRVRNTIYHGVSFSLLSIRHWSYRTQRN